MIDCRRTIELLAVYVDHTLPADQRSEVDAHLAACPPCRAAAVTEQGGRILLRDRAATLRAEPLPPGLRSRCEALARQHVTTRSQPVWRTRYVPSLIMAVTVLGVAVAVFSLATRRSNTLLAAQLTLDHAKCFKLFPSPENDGVDARQVEAMLSDRYGWAIHVPPSSPVNGITLIGARRCLYGAGSVPHVMYEVNGRDVSLYVLGGTTRHAADLVTLGHRSHIWTRGNTTYVLVSGADERNLSRVTNYVMQEVH